MTSNQRIFSLMMTLLFVLSAEVAHAEIIYVKSNATGANTGLNWADAFTNLQSAIDAPGSFNQIWIAQGTYSPGAAASDFFFVKNTVAWIGGFEGLPGTEEDASTQSPSVFVTTLNGSLVNDYVIRGLGITDPNTTIDGLTVTGGALSGIRLQSCALTLSRLKVDGNGLGTGRGGRPPG